MLPEVKSSAGKKTTQNINCSSAQFNHFVQGGGLGTYQIEPQPSNHNHPPLTPPGNGGEPSDQSW